MSAIEWERITAGDVREGDLIAYSRNHSPFRITEVIPKAKSVWLVSPDGGRVRPRYGLRIWRVVEAEES
jgi:hypothetical protein